MASFQQKSTTRFTAYIIFASLSLSCSQHCQGQYNHIILHQILPRIPISYIQLENEEIMFIFCIENGYSSLHLYFMLPKKRDIYYTEQTIEVGFLNRMPNRNCPTFILSCATKPIKRTSQFVRTTKPHPREEGTRVHFSHWISS